MNWILDTAAMDTLYWSSSFLVLKESLKIVIKHVFICSIKRQMLYIQKEFLVIIERSNLLLVVKLVT